MGIESEKLSDPMMVYHCTIFATSLKMMLQIMIVWALITNQLCDDAVCSICANFVSCRIC